MKNKKENKEVRVWDIYKKRYIPEDVYVLHEPDKHGAFGTMTSDWEEYREGEVFYPGNQEIHRGEAAQ